MADQVDKRLFAAAKKKALGKVPLFALGDETKVAMSALRTALREDIDRLQNLWDRRSQAYRDEDPHAVSAWLEDVGNLADTLEDFDEAAPDQWVAVHAAMGQMMEGDGPAEIELEVKEW